MISLRESFRALSFVLLLDGCGAHEKTAVPVSKPLAAKRDFIVTFDGESHVCLVALYTEAQGSAVPCKEVGSFARNELGIPSGSIYDLRTIPKINDAEMLSLAASLRAAGYRYIRGRYAAFIEEPSRDH
jgi:hypothetical protein